MMIAPWGEKQAKGEMASLSVKGDTHVKGAALAAPGGGGPS